MNIQMFEALSLSQISELESQLRIKLPDDYKDFLMRIGGGIVEKDDINKIYIKDIGENVVVDVLYGNDPRNIKGSIIFWMKQFESEIYPESIIIGDDIQQGFFILICSGDNKGVYYWDDSYNFKISNDENNMYWIADSFNQFLKMLQ